MSHDQPAKKSHSRSAAAQARLASVSQRMDVNLVATEPPSEGEARRESSAAGRRMPLSVRLLVVIAAALILWSLVLAGARLLFG
jgi:Flp pilus assembly protein TadB